MSGADDRPDDGSDEVPATPTEPPSPGAWREAIVTSVAVTLATAAAITYAFDPARAGSAALLVAIGALYVVLGAATFYRLYARGELAEQMKPRYGDLALGAAAAGLLYGVATAGHLAITGPGSPRVGWIMRLYLQIGDPDAEGQVLVGASVFLIAALEEITWRGLVMRALEGPMGQTRAWLASTLLYTAAHLPTLFLLADARAGYNPLLVLAALGCGLVWGRIAIRADRLVPAIFAHALFSWAIVEFPVWRP